VSTQVGEQFEQRQGRLRSPVPVSDRSSGMAAELVLRIAVTQQEACASLGCSEESFVEHVGPHMGVVCRGCERLFPAAEVRREVAAYALLTGRSER
jgi:hypothetical protein